MTRFGIKSNKKRQWPLINKKGSYTVEATFVFVFLVFVIFTLVFGLMVLEQNVFLAKAASSAASNATAECGYVSDPALEAAILKEVEIEMKSSIFKVDDVEKILKISYEGGFYNSVLVEINQEIPIPIGQIKKLFTGKDYITVRGIARVTSDNPVQSLRNVDLLEELYLRKDEILRNNSI